MYGRPFRQGQGDPWYLTGLRKDGTPRDVNDPRVPMVIYGDFNEIADAVRGGETYDEYVLRHCPGEGTFESYDADIESLNAVLYPGLICGKNYKQLRVRHNDAHPPSADFIGPLQASWADHILTLRREEESGKFLGLCTQQGDHKRFNLWLQLRNEKRWGNEDSSTIYENPFSAEHRRELSGFDRNSARQNLREEITAALKEAIADGRVLDRSSQLDWLRSKGFTIKRGDSAEFISVWRPGLKKNLRLEGPLYDRARLKEFVAAAGGQPVADHRRSDQDIERDLSELRSRIEWRRRENERLYGENRKRRKERCRNPVRDGLDDLAALRARAPGSTEPSPDSTVMHESAVVAQYDHRAGDRLESLVALLDEDISNSTAPLTCRDNPDATITIGGASPSSSGKQELTGPACDREIAGCRRGDGLEAGPSAAPSLVDRSVMDPTGRDGPSSGRDVGPIRESHGIDSHEHTLKTQTRPVVRGFADGVRGALGRAGDVIHGLRGVAGATRKALAFGNELDLLAQRLAGTARHAVEAFERIRPARGAADLLCEAVGRWINFTRGGPQSSEGHRNRQASTFRSSQATGDAADPIRPLVLDATTVSGFRRLIERQRVIYEKAPQGRAATEPGTCQPVENLEILVDRFLFAITRMSHKQPWAPVPGLAADQDGWPVIDLPASTIAIAANDPQRGLKLELVRLQRQAAEVKSYRQQRRDQSRPNFEHRTQPSSPVRPSP